MFTQDVYAFHIATVAPERKEAEFPHAVHHRPIAFSILRLRGELDSLDVKLASKSITDLKQERPLVKHFFQRMPQNDGVLLSYAGNSFVLPVMTYRALRYGIEHSGYYFPFHPSQLPDRSVDLSEFLSGYGAVHGAAAFSDFAQMIGLAKRIWLDVFEAFEAGNMEEIVSRLEIDVMIIVAIYLRILLSQATLNREQFREAAKTVLKFFYSRSVMARKYLQRSNFKSFVTLNEEA